MNSACNTIKLTEMALVMPALMKATMRKMIITKREGGQWKERMRQSWNMTGLLREKH
jgi:hypothetical protein